MSQPKRLALLAYLAVQAPEPEARERLLPMFWPDSDPSHARLSLRQAVHFIRAASAAVGECDILISSNGGRLGLDRSRVWCDVLEFDSRLTAGDYVTALALYRGDFLHGVYVPGAPDLEHWLERERTRLRRAAEMACLKAAEEEIESGNNRAALYWAHRGEAIAPDSEHFLQLQMTLSEKSADRPQELRDSPVVERRKTPTEDFGAILNAPSMEWRDPQTGLYNHKAFNVLSEHRRALASETGMPLDFLAVTIRELDRIEVDRGPAEADRALSLVAQALVETFRKSDVVARLTRNRFVVIGSDWDGQGLASSITRLTGTASARAAIRLGYRVDLDISRVQQPAPSIALPARRAV